MTTHQNITVTKSLGAMCMSCQRRKATGFVMTGKYGNIKRYSCDVCKPGNRSGGFGMTKRKVNT